jgi:DNA-binding XRE family transcriptional regulator
MALPLVRYRADHGLTQEGLSEMLGVPSAGVGRLELG